MEGAGLGTTLAKLFAHGILFAVLTTAFSFVIGLGLLGIMIVGFEFGGLAGFFALVVVLFVLIAMAYGYANSVITRYLWFPVRRGLGTYLGHGLLLLVLLLFAESLPVFLIALFLVGLSGNPSLVIPFEIVVTVAFAVVTGFVGRGVASVWREGPRVHVTSAYAGSASPSLLTLPSNPDGLHCPMCGRTRLVVAADRSAFCIDCQKGIVSL